MRTILRGRLRHHGYKRRADENAAALIGSAAARVAAGIAHDLRNPLQNVIFKGAAIRLMSDGDLTPARIREETEQIVLQAERAARIVDDLSLLGCSSLSFAEQVDLNQLIESCLSLLRSQIEKSRIEVVCALQPELPAALGHSVALERVFMNVLTNAIQAMPQGGRIRIVSAKDAGALQATISDTGHGIAPEAIPRVFDLHYTTKPGGSGLGLWLSRRIIRQHRGTLKIESQLDRGTTVMISLPSRRLGSSINRR